MARESVNLQAELENRIRFETLISDISARFIRSPSSEIDNEIENALKQILKFFDVDRCGIMEVRENEQFAWLTHICTAEGIESLSKDINLAAIFPWCYEKLIIKGEHVLVSRMTELPPEAQQDQLSFLSMGAKSNLTISLFSTKGVRHMLAIQSVKKERDWPQEFVPRLKLLGEIFVNALERRDAYKALSESESRLNLAAEAAGAGLWVLNIETNIFWLTEKTRDLFGFRRNTEISFDSFLDVVHPDDRERLLKTVQQAFETKQETSVQYRINHPDGNVHWMSSRGRTQFRESAHPNLLMGVSVDITERKQAEEMLVTSQEELHILAGKLLAAQEEERRRLARDLHDDLSQRLAILAIEAGKLEKQPKILPAQIANKFKQIREQLVAISTDVHDISRQLHPSIIDDLGLVDAMKSECSLFSRRENIDIRFKAENVPSKIPRDTALCLYRVSQEAIRNIKKHARTGKAIVLLTGDNDELVLRVRDQGAGFKLEKAHHKTGLGLASMGERVRLINGKFVVKSEIGAGTTIEVRVPLLEK